MGTQQNTPQASAHEDQRHAKRLDATLSVRFSVNGGERHTCNTMNFTHRSLAIRSDVAVKKGDHVIADVDNLPPIEGEVVRIFHEGFAVRLTDTSIALVAHAKVSIPELNVKTPRSSQVGSTGVGANTGPAVGTETERRLSPLFKLKAPFPAWGRIATSRNILNRSQNHVLSIISTQTFELENLRSVWLRVDDTRWIARVINIGTRGKQSIAVIAVNDWQVRMMAINGFSVSVAGIKADGWTISASSAPIAAHLEDVTGEAVEPSAGETSAMTA